MEHIFLWIAVVLLFIISFIQAKKNKALEKEIDNNRRLLEFHFNLIMELKFGKK